MQAQTARKNKILKLVLKKNDKKQTYSNRSSNWINLLCYPSFMSPTVSSVQVKKLMKDGRGDLEISHKKGKGKDIEKW